MSEPTHPAAGPPANVPAAPPPDLVKASDAEREAVVARLQAAVGEGRIDLDEFAERVDRVYAGRTVQEIAAVLADLPAQAIERVSDTSGSATVVSVFGDVTITATAGAPARCSTIFGDVRVDLRGLRTDADVVELSLRTVFGDVEVIVPEGMAAELGGRTIFGDRKTQLAAVPRLAGTPRVVVHASTAFGDLRLRSLAPGESPSRWRALLERLATARQPPPAGGQLPGGPGGPAY